MCLHGGTSSPFYSSTFLPPVLMVQGVSGPGRGEGWVFFWDTGAFSSVTLLSTAKGLLSSTATALLAVPFPLLAGRVGSWLDRLPVLMLFSSFQDIGTG